jgi:type III pantothenate kinase
MIDLCLDVGNTQIFGGFMQDSEVVASFRMHTKSAWSADQIGVFWRCFARENHLDLTSVCRVIIASVVPSLDDHLRQAVSHYIGVTPIILGPETRTGLHFRRSSREIGADLIAGAVGAVARYPDSPLIIVDMGTATTITAISPEPEFLTTLILPGMETQMRSLASSAEKLFMVEPIPSPPLRVASTVEAIQAGVYYTHLGGLQYIIPRMTEEFFASGPPVRVIATGGYADLFSDANLFDAHHPFLLLEGLSTILARQSDC